LEPLAVAVPAALSGHPAVSAVRLVGSRARGEETALSDWDFIVETDGFDEVAADIERLVAPLDPIGQQWDPLSEEWCYMLTLRGPVKIDLIFDRRHEPEPPWSPSPQTAVRMDRHFWDWLLWLATKEAAGRRELVESELDKLFGHLLEPMGVSDAPGSLREAIELYLQARGELERRLDIRVPRDLEREVLPVVWRVSN
jgi:predicted nucleotidyltransferase